MGGCIGRYSEEHESLVNSNVSSDNEQSAPRTNGTVHDSIVSQHHGYMGGARRDQSLPSESGKESALNDRRRKKKPHTTPQGKGEVPQPRVAGLDFVDSGLSVTSPSRTTGSLTRSQSFTSGVSRPSVISSNRGKDLQKAIHNAYKWKDEFSYPSKEFLAEMDKLFMDCQVHLTDLSSRSNVIVQKEADALVEELIALRNHWGPRLLPNSVCNGFVRERIYLNLGFQRYRIDCAQFFEPVPFYHQSSNNPGELMKLYRFSVYELSRNEVIIRYFLERSNVIQLYHVLCYVHGNQRGQVQPYGSECPTYWELRTQMINDLCIRFHTGSVKS